MKLKLTFLASALLSTGVFGSDLVLTNAIIYGHSNADTVAISEGKIAEIGDARDIVALQSSNATVIDLEGGFLSPGFIDNHNHVFEAASEAGAQCELSVEKDLAGQIPFLKACREETQRSGWVMGYGFSIDSLLAEESNQTPLQIIDTIFPDQPVIFMEQTSHSMWVNSAALELAGITSETPEPQGGKILKDDDSGKLNGILLDNAGDIVLELAWNSLNNQFEQSYLGLMQGLAEAKAHGITTIGDGRLYWKRGWYEVWQHAENKVS